jgi:hypothetical protein
VFLVPQQGVELETLDVDCLDVLGLQWEERAG